MANQALIYILLRRAFFAALGVIMGEVCTLVLFYYVYQDGPVVEKCPRELHSLPILCSSLQPRGEVYK